MAASSLYWSVILRVRIHNTGIRLLPSYCSHHSFQAPTISLLREYSTTSDHRDDKLTMSFKDYRKLKKSLKIRRRMAGLPMAFLGMGLSSMINVYLNPRMFEMTPEEIQPILGLDPIMFAALCGVGSGVLGYMVGGALFTSTWKLMARSKSKEFHQREEDFLERIQKHRFSAVNHYEDDYYGDKIMNLSDYRQWIRQQQKRKENLRAQEADLAASKKSDSQ